MAARRPPVRSGEPGTEQSEQHLSRFLRDPLCVVALLAFVLAAAALVCRYLPVTNHVVLIGAVMAPYLVVAAAISVVLFVARRRWPMAGAAAALTVALIAVQVPLFAGDTVAIGDTTDVRVLSVNVMKGRADAPALVRLAQANADVVTAVELTPDMVQRLSSAGMDEVFPYRLVEPLGGASGIGLWSRYPLSGGSVGSDYFLSHIHATAAVPDADVDPVIAAVHIPAPWPTSIRKWQRSIAVTDQIMTQLADAAGLGAVIVAGDFNSTYDMADFRWLLRDGYRDALEQYGAGLSPTFQSGGVVPPIVGIDHVLVRNGDAASAHTVEIVGSDHRGVLATVRIARS